MIELCHIALIALHPEKNIRRSYRVSLGRDLLGAWSVELRYGRIGQSAQQRHVACVSLEDACRIAHAHLRRRLSAPRRIGCAYRIVSFDPGADDLFLLALPIGLVTR